MDNNPMEPILRSGKSPLFSISGLSDTFSEEYRIVLHLGDSYEFLKTLPSNTATLIITSPPYNIGKEYETKTSIESYLEQQKPVIGELVRILRSEGSLCWEVGNYVEDSEVFPLDIFYYKLFEDKGLKLRNRIIWHFGHGGARQKAAERDPWTALSHVRAIFFCDLITHYG
jgi:adenine-specific DNA-methyltransferase